MQIKKIFPLIFLGILLSCNDINESMVPNLQVKITLRLNNTAHQLNSAGGYHSIKQIANEAPYIGYGGVLIVNNIVGDGRTYHAFDLACPVENKQTVRITMNDDFTAECKECGSKFGQVMYGNPIPTDGTAAQRKLKLRQYFNIGYDSNNNTLTIIN